MTKNQNTYVKLQIEKDQNSGGLALNVRFDKNAPNFNVEKDTISWSPTLEEIDFVNEAFDMIGRSMGHPSSSRASTPPSPSTPTTTPPQNYPQPEEAPPLPNIELEKLELSIRPCKKLICSSMSGGFPCHCGKPIVSSAPS